MNTYDLVLQKECSEQSLVLELSKIYSISANSIIAKSEFPTEEISSDIKILLIVDTVYGEFCQHLSVYIKDEQLLSINEETLAKKLSEQLNTEVLITTDEDNPFTMQLVTPDNNIKTVKLDPDLLDEDSYTIVE